MKGGPQFTNMAPAPPPLAVFYHPSDGTCQDLSAFKIWSF